MLQTGLCPIWHCSCQDQAHSEPFHASEQEVRVQSLRHRIIACGSGMAHFDNAVPLLSFGVS